MLVTSIFAFHKMFTSFPKQTLLFEPSVGSPLQMLSLKLIKKIFHFVLKMFSKASFLRVVISLDSVVKSYIK